MINDENTTNYAGIPTKPRGKGLFRSIYFRLVSGFLVVCLAAGGGFLGGLVYDRQVVQPHVQRIVVPPGATNDFNLMVQAWNVIQKEYVDRPAVKNDSLTYGAISGMVDALGDTGHSRFMTPEMVRSEQSYEKGSFEGIGATVEEKDGHAVIVAPFDGSPAQKAGVMPGDIILKVDGVDVTGMPLEAVTQRILGKAGTQVKITLQNPTTKEIRTLTITRAQIKIQNISWVMIPGTKVADLHVAGFSNGVTNDLKKAIQEIKAQGATSVVLDLRNNPGGLLDEAIGVSSQFLSSGYVMQEKDAAGKVIKIPVRPGGGLTDLPMVVLINQGTASAAEITSGAIQDAGRAKLLGDTTFGTGTVLNQFPLSDQSALLLATGEWLTPKGRVIWHQGIVPDTAISLPANVIPLDPAAVREMSASQLQASQDTQLLKALEMLGVNLGQ